MKVDWGLGYLYCLKYKLLDYLLIVKRKDKCIIERFGRFYFNKGFYRVFLIIR